jgi:phospholipase C
VYPVADRFSRVAPFASFAVLASILAACGSDSPGPGAAGRTPRLDHVIVVIMENRNYGDVRSEPYTASLIASGTLLSNSHAVTHPSQPNYLALWSGSTQGVDTNDCPAPGSPFTTENLGHAVEAAGLTWRAYSEDLPEPGSSACAADADSYTRKHNPWTNWSNLNHDFERPYSDLARDIANRRLPDLAFVIPNNCHNTHDCGVVTGDDWLSRNLPAMIQAVGSRGLVILTYDEDDDGSNHILTVFAGGSVKSGLVQDQNVTHYTILRTITDALGLRPIGRAASEPPMVGIWHSRSVTGNE